MKRYDRYKESGISWIGEIPEHWEKRRCKDILTECKELVGHECDNYTLLSLTTNGVIIRDVSEGKGKFPKDFDTYKVVNPGNLIFCLFDVDETPRTVGCSCHRGMITGAYNVFSVESVRVDYLCYYFISLDDRKALKPLYRGLRKVVPLPTFMSMQIYLPPLSEQETIVAYLVEKVAQIDNLVAKQEAQISYLRELKQAIIAKSVIQGIDPQAPLRPSGIPWIGNIPEHWEEVKMRKIIDFFSDKGYPDETLLSVVRERGVIIRDTESKEENHNYIPSDLSGYKRVQQGDFVINKMKAWQGSYAVSDYQGIVSPAYYTCKLRIPNKVFFNLAIRSKVYVPFFTQYSKGIRVDQWDLSPIGLKDIPFFLPPPPEQEAIVTYINRKTEEIDRLIAMREQEIARVRDLKQTVIADVVTGRINVQPS